MLIEVDTRKTYFFQGGTWVESAGGTGGGGTVVGGGGMTDAGIYKSNGTASQVNFTWTHNMGAIPDVVTVEAASTDALGEFVISKTATTLTATYVEPPPSGLNNVWLEWAVGMKAGAGAPPGSASAGGVYPGNGNGSTVTFSIPHGLLNTPTVAHVVPNSTDAMGPFTVGITNTHLVVTYAVAPPSGAAGNVSLLWSAGFTGLGLAGAGGGIAPPETLPYSWLIYKSGTNYRARSGFTGQVLVSDPSLNVVWNYIAANFNQSGEETARGGIVQFGKGTFTFNTVPAPIDTSWTSNGITIQGMGTLATNIMITPSTTATNGFHLKVSAMVMRDLMIQVNANVTNAIYCDTSTGLLHLNSLYENLRIQPTVSLITANQRAIYIFNRNLGGGSGEAMHATTFRKVQTRYFDYAIEAVAENPFDGTSNASFMNFEDIYLHSCPHGIKLGPSVIQNTISNIRHQACDPAQPPPNNTALQQNTYYTVSLDGAKYNVVTNITTDNLSTSGDTGAVVLGPGAHYNKVSNIANSGGRPAVLDFSGSVTNNISGITSSADPGFEKTGEWPAVSATFATGILSGPAGAGFNKLSTTTTVSTAPDADFFGSAIGKSVLFTTNASTGNINGIRSSGKVATRQIFPRLVLRWTNATITTNPTFQRFFIGFCGEAFLTPDPTGLLPTASDTAIPVTAKATAGIAKISSSTDYKIVYNDGLTGDPTITDALKDDGTKTGTNIPIPCDTNPHYAVIYLHDAPTPRLFVSMDNQKPQVFTSNIPGQSDSLYILAYVETIQNFQHKLNINTIRLETRQ